ncbi:hypothetical protein [Psychrobium sp. 1_MG-2023]|uniref:hypothetical protein n=1 Tax=Psychrobium sp. 1_MG-2023 TaxID=3062624 RepID=UPI002733C4D4|nr:hypothetical protein [Psychrobium sp. 1_MG-2023]MDP2560759.1 hypothetical protein [Psychrobium sp. 1_MG-2023]
MTNSLSNQLKETCEGLAKGQKLILTNISTSNMFLPPLEEVMNQVGFKWSLYIMLQHLVSITGIKLGISDTSIRNLSGTGVGKNTQSKLINFFSKISCHIPKLSLSSSTISDVSNGARYAEWRQMIKGFNSKNHLDLELLINFLEKRCEQENLLYQGAREMQGLQTLRSDVDKASWVYKFWFEHTKLNKEDIHSLKKYAKERVNRKPSIGDLKTLSIPALKMQLDFYFEMMAHFEVGLINYYRTYYPSPEESKRHDLLETGFFIDLLPKVLTHESTRNELVLSAPFESFLNNLRYKLNPKAYKEGNEISWYELAKHIPLVNKKSESSATSTQRTKTELLNDWRKGASYPRRDVVKKFLVNILGFESRGIEEIAMIAIALNKMVDKHLNELFKSLPGISAIEIGEIIEETYDNYKMYWQDCKITHLKKG